MSNFNDRLDHCLDALQSGDWTIDDCLREYPDHAERLRARLLAAQAISGALAAGPREEFARAARARFLVASGDAVADAFDVESSAAFRASARARYLIAARAMHARKQQRRAAPRLGAFGETLWGFAGAGAAAALLFVAFSIYTVATASSALPGDWQYPVKLQTERVHLALTFGDNAKRSVKLDIAEERSHEIDRLAHNGETIGSQELARLVKQTQPLVEDVSSGEWDANDLTRLQSIAETQKVVLQDVTPQVEATAHDELITAVDLSQRGVIVSTAAIVSDPSKPALVLTPNVPLGTRSPVTRTATSETGTPQPTETADGTMTPGVERTPIPQNIHGVLTIDPRPVARALGANWLELSVGDFSALVPLGGKDGWRIERLNGTIRVEPAPAFVQLADRNGKSRVSLNTETGDVHWFIARGGYVDEVQMRVRQPNGEVLLIDRDVLRTAYGAQAEVPLFILDSVNTTPPSPTPRTAPTIAATTTPNGEAGQSRTGLH